MRLNQAGKHCSLEIHLVDYCHNDLQHVKIVVVNFAGTMLANIAANRKTTTVSVRSYFHYMGAVYLFEFQDQFLA